jgi:hypothetical protein
MSNGDSGSKAIDGQYLMENADISVGDHGTGAICMPLLLLCTGLDLQLSTTYNTTPVR